MDNTRLRRSRRQGFALITVLWVMAAASIVLLRFTLTGRDAFASARNRTLLTRASWTAEGCVESARSLIDRILSDPSQRGTEMDKWVTLERRLRLAVDSVRRASPLLAHCALAITATGTRVDLNLATPEQLQRVIQEGTGAARRDLADAIADWRDADGVVRATGAERDWYTARERAIPRNAPIAHLRELSLVRGFEDSALVAGVALLLGVEQGAVSLNNAPLPVLLTVPGITREAAALILEAQRRGRPIADLQDLSGRLSPSGSDTLLANFPEAVRLSVLEPAAWVLRVDADAGSPPLTYSLEIRLVRSGDHVALVRRRSSP